MRPIKLTLAGLNSFVEEQTVDFETLAAGNLFCIAGCTGSGKSTILDGMILSLYNLHSDRGTLADYINLRCSEAKLRFEFELDGEVYETERTISRQAGKNRFILRRGGQTECEGDAAYKFVGEKIGLDEKEFTHVVVLGQGEFARFLKAKKADRVALIGKLFDLRRFRDLYSIFNRKACELRTRAEQIEQFAEGYAAVTDESVSELEKRLAELENAHLGAEKRVAELTELAQNTERAYELYIKEQKTAAEIAAKESALAALVEREKKGKEHIAALNERERELSEREKGRDALIARKAVLDDLEKKSRALAEKEKDLAARKKELAELERGNRAASAELEAAENAAVAAGRDLKTALSAAGIEEDNALGAAHAALAACDRYAADEVRARKEREQCAAERDERAKLKDKLIEDWSRANSMHKELEKALAEAESGYAAAVEAYEKAASGNALALVTEVLTEGDVCPICGNRIDKLHHAVSTDLGAMKAARDEAQQRKSGAEASLAKSQTNIGVLTEKADEAAKALERAEAVFAESEKVLASFDINRNTVRANALKSLLDKLENDRVLREKRDAARLRRDREKALFETEKRAVGDLERALDAERAELSKSAPAEGERERIEAELAALAAARSELGEARKKADALMGEITGGIAAARAEIDAARGTLTGAAEVTEQAARDAKKAELEMRAELMKIVSEAGAEKVRLEREKKDLSVKKEYEKELKRISADRGKYEVMARIFNKNAFTEFVAAEYIKDFTAAASERLGSLTGGKYALEYDESGGEFYVRDFLSGNERRSVKTLSGGETFLASLSLAIAISGELSKSKSFGFFFIDEGFGTLSADALDTVTAALERLAQTTLVGVITHRSELIERMPMALKVLPADGNGGSKLTY